MRKTHFFGTVLLGLAGLLMHSVALPVPAFGQKGCDEALLPVVFVHGFLASGDTYAGQVRRFGEQGYCPGRLRAFDWNTLGGSNSSIARLDAFIDRLRRETGAAKVNLVGHSAGGGLCYTYLSDPARAAKVAHYVHVGSGAQPKPAGASGEVPTLNLYSEGDRTVPGKDIPGAVNKRFTGLDHYQVAASEESFLEMFTFFNPGKRRVEKKAVLKKKVPIGGRVVTLGENAPQKSAAIEIYALHSSTGLRQSEKPLATLQTDTAGYWGPWQADAKTHYEFMVKTGTEGERPIHYYREPFALANPLVYLRVLPGSSSPAGLLLAALPKSDTQSVTAVFSSSRAVVSGRDRLEADGMELSSEALCPASKTIIALFLYDGGDGQSSGKPHAGFQMMRSFLTGIDVAARPGNSLRLLFNGRALTIPNRKASQGVNVAVFD